MNRLLFVLALMTPGVIALPRAQAEVRITIVAADPASAVVSLGRDEP